MDEQDDSIAQLYRRSSREEPPAQLDLAVLELARRALRRRAWSPFGGNWLATGGVAAVALLSVVLVVLMQEQADISAPPQAPAEREVPQAPASAGTTTAHEAGRIRLPLPPASARREAADAEPLPDAAPKADAAAAGSTAAVPGRPAAQASAPPGAAGPPRPRFDFYRTLPEMQVEVPERAPPATARPVPPAAPVTSAPAAAAPASEPSAATVPAVAADAARQPVSAPAAAPQRQEAGAAPVAPAPAAASAGQMADKATGRTLPPAAPTTGYYLQVGAFRAADYAGRFKARLEALQLPAGVEAIRLANGETWHRVRVGPYQDMTAVEGVRARLKAAGIDSMLVRVDEND
ncbi:MAG: SPOR domain-containing protein [Pseudomonadota bacterium]